MDEPKVIPSKFRIPLLIGLVLVLASGAVLYVQQQKKSELDAAIELVKIKSSLLRPCRWLSWTIPEKPSSFMSFRQ